MSQQKKCFLKSILDDNIAIHLQDKVEICLGRCPETNIRDKRCSRKQVSITADYNSEVIKVKHLGGNPSSANGIILRNDSHILKQNELLEFLVGEHKFRVEFESPTVKPEKRKNETSTLENDSSDSKRFCKEESISMLTAPCSKSTWEKIEDGKLYVFTSVGVTSSTKIAAYDLDGTLILTKSGRVFPKDNDDWKLAFGSVKSKLSKFASEGYKIVILTNQAGIGRGRTNINEFKTKIENIVRDLNVPVQVFIATSNSIYRKPAPGMWTFLETKKNDGIKIDMSRSFYVGDAAGRIANWCPGKKKDFSFADRLLALNLNLQYYTPEEHFCNERPGKFTLPMFNPAALDEDGPLADGDIAKKSQEDFPVSAQPNP
ncbi:hypothetical protein J6590_013964 [Homalodisca vitripennis]|nr:hypothetical protein J6590_013964 [Homalodisca vitripennis]